jgi:protein O-GlcNAc transferase
MLNFFRKVFSINKHKESNFKKCGNEYLSAGNLVKAEECYREHIKNQPDDAEGYLNLGFILTEQQLYDKAEPYLLKSIALSPKNADAFYLLGVAYQNMRVIKRAIDYYQLALNVNPFMEDAYHQLYQIYVRGDESVEVKSLLIKSVTSAPACALAQYYVGCVYLAENRVDQALDFFNKAAALDPKNEKIYLQMGNAHQQKGEYILAISAYQKAIELNPSFAASFSNLAMAFNVLHNYEKAIINYEKAFQLGIKTQNIVNKIASALHMQGKLDESIEKYRHALTIPADDATMNMTYSNFLFTYTYSKYSPAQYLNEAKAYGQRVLSQATPYQNWLTDMNINSDRSLRVGLVSADLLGRHPVGCFIDSLLAKINKNRLQVVIYAAGNKGQDELSARIKSHAVAWYNINDLSDELVAKKIRDDCIDILIDLSGHTGENRLALFAWRPAPVQVTWLGYWASTGLPGMDYLLADEVSLPVEDHPHFSEKIHYLPNTRICLESPRYGEETDVSPLPAHRKGYVTFGSFQNAVKINIHVLAVWCKLLEAIPTAKLRLQSPLFVDPGVCAQLFERLASANIDTKRVMIELPQFYRDYLRAYSEIDIVLDTFPFPGGTTTCEALWMGVPTVTLAGDTMIARQGASMLTCAGLKDWVANTEEEYLNIAINKASDLQSLANLRKNLREQVRTSPLCNAQLFAHNFENAMFDMWKEKVNILSENNNS